MTKLCIYLIIILHKENRKQKVLSSFPYYDEKHISFSAHWWTILGRRRPTTKAS